MQELDSVVHEKVAENTIKVFIEKVKGIYYIYNKENNDFMGQGLTREEVEKVLAERFPNKKFMADTANLKEVGF